MKPVRQLTTHLVPGDSVNHQLLITVDDEPGAGGANHLYSIHVPTDASLRIYPILFQNGPIKEAGVNGLTHEALLAILIDRLRSFQIGPFNCKENHRALTHLEEALLWLQSRTVARIRRGVEGAHQQ